MQTSQSFSILIWANKVKTDDNGQVPLYARITVNGKRAEISLKKKIDPTLWEVKRGNLKGSSKDIKITNSYFSQVRNDLFKICVELLNGHAVRSCPENLLEIPFKWILLRKNCLFLYF